MRIEVRFDDFVKDYFIDLLVGEGAAFELKAARDLSEIHRSQMLNYLLLAGLTHGKLINFRTDSVQHEFVNCHQSLASRRTFQVEKCEWREPESGRGSLLPWFVRFVEDVGTGLDLQLYSTGISHFWGCSKSTAQPISIIDHGRIIGSQKVELAVDGWAFRITAVSAVAMPLLRRHLLRFLKHTDLEAIQWINLTRDRISFCTLTN